MPPAAAPPLAAASAKNVGIVEGVRSRANTRSIPTVDDDQLPVPHGEVMLRIVYVRGVLSRTRGARRACGCDEPKLRGRMKKGFCFLGVKC